MEHIVEAVVLGAWFTFIFVGAWIERKSEDGGTVDDDTAVDDPE